MLELLADLGRASIEAVWLPVVLWTVLAALVESGLRLGESPAVLALPIRGALLAALPVTLAIPVVLSSLQPETAALVTEWAFVPTDWRAVAPADTAPGTAALGLPLLDLALGALLLLALATSVVHLARVGGALVGIAQTRRLLIPAGHDRHQAVSNACRRLGVTRRVAVAEAPAEATPFTLGWLRPVVALPDLDASAREVAALHEVAHIARADYAWNVAQRVVTAAFAAHPLVSVLGRGLDLDRERATDALVLRACPGRRRTYANLLFSYASLPAPPLALGTSDGSSSLKQRIDTMNRPLSPRRTEVILRLGRALGAVLIVAVGALSTLAAAPSSSTPVAQDTSPSDVSEATNTAGTVRGIVTASDTGEPISRATLQVIDRTIGATTGPDGRYVLVVPDSAFTIGVSAPGYEPTVVELAAGQTQLDVVLERGSAPEPDASGVFDVADVQPELIGGIQALAERIVYPDVQRRAGIEGRAIVQFVVDADGSVAGARVVRSAGDDALDQAALAAVEGLEFTPGTVEGSPVRVRFAVPIVFSLAGSNAPSDGEARAARYPDAKLTMSGIDLSLFRDADLVSFMLVANGQILRERYPALPDGTEAEVTFDLDADGRMVGDIRVAVEAQPDDSDRGLAGLSRGIAALVWTPAPALAGQTITFTTTYVRGD